MYLLVASWRYGQLLKKIGIVLGFRDYFLLYVAGESMAITPGGLGSVVKSHILEKTTGKSFSSTAPIVLFERWIDLGGILLALGILSVLMNIMESTIVLIIGSSFFIAGFAFLKTKLGLAIFTKLTSKIRFFKKFASQFEESQESVSKLFSIEIILKTLPSTLILRILAIVTVFLIFTSLDIDFDMLLSGHIYFTSTIIGSLSFLPAGIIVTEASLLGLILKNGVNLGLATITVFIIRLVTLWFTTIIGFFSLKFLLNKKTAV